MEWGGTEDVNQARSLFIHLHASADRAFGCGFTLRPFLLGVDEMISKKCILMSAVLLSCTEASLQRARENYLVFSSSKNGIKNYGGYHQLCEFYKNMINEL